MTADLSLSQYSSWALLPTCQLWVLWLLSSSPRLSRLWFHSCWALRCQRVGPAIFTTHINLHCTPSALAPRVKCVVGAVVYMSCPRLVSLLVVFSCFSGERAVVRCHVSGGSAKQQHSRCCHSLLLLWEEIFDPQISAGTTKKDWRGVLCLKLKKY